MNGFWEQTLHEAVVSGTPLAIAGLGELIAETAGLINLGVEGMMLMGAVTAYGAALASNNVWLGLFCGFVVGALFGALHALFTVSLRINQIAVGLVIVFLGTGLSGYLGSGIAGAPLRSVIAQVDIPVLQDIPVLGPIFFQQDIVVYATAVVTVAVWYLLRFTVAGLDLRAAGENPGAADAAGVRVYLVRYLAAIGGGGLAGVAGGYFTIAFAHAWADSITNGRGWIAIALVIAASWRPLRLLLFALLFGVVDSLDYSLQAWGTDVPSSLLQMLPYVFTLVMIAATTLRRVRRSSGLGPAALGLAYDREERI
jgi:general nucleoside transport system permease protein